MLAFNLKLTIGRWSAQTEGPRPRSWPCPTTPDPRGGLRSLLLSRQPNPQVSGSAPGRHCDPNRHRKVGTERGPPWPTVQPGQGAPWGAPQSRLAGNTSAPAATPTLTGHVLSRNKIPEVTFTKHSPGWEASRREAERQVTASDAGHGPASLAAEGEPGAGEPPAKRPCSPVRTAPLAQGGTLGP